MSTQRLYPAVIYLLKGNNRNKVWKYVQYIMLYIYMYIYTTPLKNMLYIYIYNAIGDIFIYNICCIYIYIYMSHVHDVTYIFLKFLKFKSRHVSIFSFIWERNGKVFGKNTVTFWQCCLYGQFVRSLLHMTIMTVAHWKFCARKYVKQHYLCWD